MSTRSALILASSSTKRLALLKAAGVEATPVAPRVDEASVRAALEAEWATPRDIADNLADLKAAKVAQRHGQAVVIGSDQVLDLDGQSLGKPHDPGAARARLLLLRGRTHRLHTAVVVHHEGRPVWRHLAEATLTMGTFSDAYLDAYLARNESTVTRTPGGYLLECEGARLFTRVEGDHFAILGLPLLPLLAYLGSRGWIDA